MSWREHAAQVVAATIQRIGNDEKELRKALREAYPFGERKYRPYKVWCDEVNRQTMGRFSKNAATTLRYTQIHTLKAQGLGDYEIAQQLKLTVKVVRRHLATKRDCSMDLFAGGDL